MHDKSHVIMIIITILNTKLEISKITVSKKIQSNLLRAEALDHYRPTARTFSTGQFVHLALYSYDNIN